MSESEHEARHKALEKEITLLQKSHADILKAVYELKGRIYAASGIAAGLSSLLVNFLK
jgi:hypothetical protein